MYVHIAAINTVVGAIDTYIDHLQHPCRGGVIQLDAFGVSENVLKKDMISL